MKGNIESTVRIIYRVEKTHLNLGLPTVFAKLVDISNLGLFLVGKRSVGKGAVLNSVLLLHHRDVIKITRITPAGLAKTAKEMSNREITLICPDFSSFYTDYLKDAGINLISHLITEHGVPKSWTGRYSYDIQNCTISFLTSTQPRMLRRVNRLATWESMYRDRFLRFYMLYPFGSPRYVEDYPEVPDVEYLIQDPATVAIPSSIKQDPRYERLLAVITRQTSQGRGVIYTNRLLKAHAWLNGRDVVIGDDLEVLTLFLPYLLVADLLSARQDVSSPLVFDPNAYHVFFYLIEHGPASRHDMVDYFRTAPKQRKGKRKLLAASAVRRALEPLLARNLVKGTYGGDRYFVNPKWYDRYIRPIIKWRDEVL